MEITIKGDVKEIRNFMNTLTSFTNDKNHITYVNIGDESNASDGNSFLEGGAIGITDAYYRSQITANSNGFAC